MKTCPKATPTTLTAQTILQMVTAIKSSFNLQTAAAYLGGFEANNCDTSQNNGVCVGYTDVGHTATDKLGKIPCIRRLRELADDLAAATSATSQQHAIAEKLNEIKSDAQELHANLHQTLVEAKAATNQATVTSTKPSAQKKECNLHKSNKTTCENTGKCKWKGGESDTKGDCKPKEGEGQTDAAAGTGDEAATKEICKSKNKDDCKYPECK
uniref:Variant surface glycoprotein n=1 Tax=Trypanosoma brucei TaxID=5691 RepID=A0A1V0FYS6_9TRYP|nr:variant surface glycoprotein [Trypanosoma brucei]